MAFATAGNYEFRRYGIGDLVVPDDLWSPDISPDKAIELFRAELGNGVERPDNAEIEALKTRSMLHTYTLLLLRFVAAATTGAVLEIGAYVGGGTTMLAHGVLPPRKMITIESGCSHHTHPHIPTLDSFHDLEQMVEAQHIKDRVSLLNMRSHDRHALSAVTHLLGGQRISVLVIDSDGVIGRDLDMYKHLCAPGCVLVVDDAVVTLENEEKSKGISAEIKKRVDAGQLIAFGAYPWSTWFGRFAG